MSFEVASIKLAQPGTFTASRHQDGARRINPNLFDLFPFIWNRRRKAQPPSIAVYPRLVSKL